MKHKKQAFEQVQRTIKWNTVRGNTPDTLDYELEVAMLQEELDEFKVAIQSMDIVSAWDALLDLEFVAKGTMSKMGISAEMQVDGYEAVLQANESKSSTKNAEGKITKPKGFVGPESQLEKILKQEEL